MKIFQFSILVTFLLFSPIFQQHILADTDRVVDSLKNRLETTNDITKIEAYIQLIKSLRNIDPALGISYSKNALELADSLGAIKAKAEIINETAVSYRKLHILEKHFPCIWMRWDCTRKWTTAPALPSRFPI